MVCLLAVLLAVPAIGRTRSVAAAVPPPIDPSMICSLSAGCLPPAPLLNVDALQSGLHAATPEQAKSLRKLEEQAIDRVIKLHGLSEGDRSAVQTWGREQVLATLYALLLNASTPTTGPRTRRTRWTG